jgi:hypothetical protein
VTRNPTTKMVYVVNRNLWAVSNQTFKLRMSHGYSLHRLEFFKLLLLLDIDTISISFRYNSYHLSNRAPLTEDNL